MSALPVLLSQVGVYEGTPVFEATLTSSTGTVISVLSYGAILRDWQVVVQGQDQGHRRSVVLGFDNWEQYLTDTCYLGAIVGRVANRTENAQFTLNGKTYSLPVNNGAHHHHGGPKGLSKKNWSMEISEDGLAVVLKTHSPAGDMGYPGAVDFATIYQLTENMLRIDMTAQVSETTPINIVQHNYFNLNGEGTIEDHQVQIEADSYTALSDAMIPTGEMKSVQGTDFDFNNFKSMSTPDGRPKPFDLNFVLKTPRDIDAPVAKILAPDDSLCLRLWTNQPGLQLYNGEYLEPEKFSGIALEDQLFPNSVNRPQFPSPWVQPENPYHHWCKIEIF